MEATVSKAAMLHDVVRNYVLKGLAEKNFDAIPYAPDVVLRGPLCPGGSEKPLQGREQLRLQWWAPLPSLLKGVELIESFANENNNTAAVEFLCHIISPACTLRVMDRFVINEAGQIVAQEVFCDPRNVTHPGWNK